MPQVQRREMTLALPDPYAEFTITVWANAPTGLWMQVFGESEEPERLAALARLVVCHNGWQDFDGEPYPPADSAAFWEAIPTEMAAAALMAAMQERKSPNFLKATGMT